MKPTANESFEALPIPRKDFPQMAEGNYKVFKNSHEYIVVNAATALEAMQASGLSQVHKIERDGLDYITVLGPGSWQVKPPAEKPVQPNAQPDNGSPSIQANAQPVPDTPLSDTEVNSLLNN